MAAITITNKDWSILSAVRSSLADATVDDAAVFASVTMTTSPRQARQCQLAGPAPKAIILYQSTDERDGIDGERNCWVSMRLLLAVPRSRWRTALCSPLLRTPWSTKMLRSWLPRVTSGPRTTLSPGCWTTFSVIQRSSLVLESAPLQGTGTSSFPVAQAHHLTQI